MLGGGVVSADMSQQQLAVRTRILTLLAWKRLAGVMAASVEVQTLLLDTETEKPAGQIRKEHPHRHTYGEPTNHDAGSIL